VARLDELTIPNAVRSVADGAYRPNLNDQHRPSQRQPAGQT
jgi:hypothetical protein